MMICGSDEPAFFSALRPLPEQQHVTATRMHATSSKRPPTAAMTITAHIGTGGSGGGELGGGGEPDDIATASLSGLALGVRPGGERSDDGVWL